MSLDDEVRLFREMLDTAEVVGQPRREAELAELARLVEKYPHEAQVMTAANANAPRPRPRGRRASGGQASGEGSAAPA